MYGKSDNRRFVAPTIRVAPASAVTVHLANHLPVATNLHFHGRPRASRTARSCVWRREPRPPDS
ncbi:multicopper oxidase domain-containing protein [Kitasatospora sp. NPDC004669]|uniref:multicopper oxidase domain-containing protein n=1 Tax=Kitasatospora sp. NPDC004669 TaxID=3154555 RepID=UPI0033B620A7